MARDSLGAVVVFIILMGCGAEQALFTVRVDPDAGADRVRILACSEAVPRYDELLPLSAAELVVAFEPLGETLAGEVEVLVQVYGPRDILAEARRSIRLMTVREEELSFSADCLRSGVGCPPDGPTTSCDERLARCRGTNDEAAPDGTPCQDGVCVQGTCTPDVAAFYPFESDLRDATGQAADGRVIQATLDPTRGWTTALVAPTLVDGALRLTSGGPSDTEGEGFLPGGDEAALAGLAADCRFTFATRVLLGDDGEGWIVAEHARVLADNALTGLPAGGGEVEGFFRGDAPRPEVRTDSVPVATATSLALVGDGRAISLWADGVRVGDSPEVASTLTSAPCANVPFQRLLVGHLARSDVRSAFVSADLDYLLLADEPLPDAVLESLAP